MLQLTWVATWIAGGIASVARRLGTTDMRVALQRQSSFSAFTYDVQSSFGSSHHEHLSDLICLYHPTSFAMFRM